MKLKFILLLLFAGGLRPIFPTDLWGYFSNLPAENGHDPWSLRLSVLRGPVSVINSPNEPI